MPQNSIAKFKNIEFQQEFLRERGLDLKQGNIIIPVGISLDVGMVDPEKDDWFEKRLVDLSPEMQLLLQKALEKHRALLSSASDEDEEEKRKRLERENATKAAMDRLEQANSNWERIKAAHDVETAVGNEEVP